MHVNFVAAVHKAQELGFEINLYKARFAVAALKFEKYYTAFGKENALRATFRLYMETGREVELDAEFEWPTEVKPNMAGFTVHYSDQREFALALNKYLSEHKIPQDICQEFRALFSTVITDNNTGE